MNFRISLFYVSPDTRPIRLGTLESMTNTATLNHDWTKQGKGIVTQYYNTIRSLWLEVDFYQTVEMESAMNSMKLKNFLEFERVFKFLAGLNSKLDRVRGQVLSGEPSLKEVHAYVKGGKNKKDCDASKFNYNESHCYYTNQFSIGGFQLYTWGTKNGWKKVTW